MNTSNGSKSLIAFTALVTLILVQNSYAATKKSKSVDIESIVNQTVTSSLNDYLNSLEKGYSQSKSFTVEKISDEVSNFIATNGKTISPTLAKLFHKTRSKIVQDKGAKIGSQATDMDIAYSIQNATDNLSAEL